MPANKCSKCNECTISEMIRLKDAVEKKLINRMPEEVREPLQEARRNIGLAFQGFVKYLTDESNDTIIKTTKKVPIE